MNIFCCLFGFYWLSANQYVYYTDKPRIGQQNIFYCLNTICLSLGARRKLQLAICQPAIPPSMATTTCAGSSIATAAIAR